MSLNIEIVVEKKKESDSSMCQWTSLNTAKICYQELRKSWSKPSLNDRIHQKQRLRN